MKTQVVGEPKKEKSPWRPGWFRETTHKPFILQVREYSDGTVLARARRGTREAFYKLREPSKAQPLKALIRLLADILDEEDLLFAQAEFRLALKRREIKGVVTI